MDTSPSILLLHTIYGHNRPKDGGPLQFANTLNATAAAIPRYIHHVTQFYYVLLQFPAFYYVPTFFTFFFSREE